MQRLALVFLSFTLAATADSATVALGVGAVSTNEVVVKIDGRDSHLRLADARPSTDPAAETFLRCLVSGRVVRVQKTSSGTAKLTLLDGGVVAELLNEFLDSRTTTDPCVLGKAAYHPQIASVAASPATPRATVQVQVPSKREGRLSFGTSSGKVAPIRMPEEVKYPERKLPPPPPKPQEVLTLATPGAMPAYSPGQAQPTTLPTASTTTVGASQTTTLPPTEPYTQTQAVPYTPPVTQQKPPEI